MSVDPSPAFSSEQYAKVSALLGESVCKSLGLFVIPDDFLLSFVIPVYNEEKTLASLVKAVAAVFSRPSVQWRTNFRRRSRRAG